MSEKKLALITGSSNGIGLALAEEFAANGYDLVIVARDEKKLSATGENLQKRFSVNVHAFSADLSEYDQITDLQARMDDAGLAPNALIINAGQGLGGAFIDGTDLEKELRLIRLNVDAVVHLSKIFIPRLVEQDNGHVLITSSLSGSAPIPFEAVYGASKAFVNSFFYAIRNELMGSGLSMTLLMPGATETNFFKNAGQASTTVGSMKKDDPKEVAKRAWYALMTGHEFVYGSEYAEYEGEVMNRMMSESHKAQRHRIISEPDSAKKSKSARRRASARRLFHQHKYNAKSMVADDLISSFRQPAPERATDDTSVFHPAFKSRLPVRMPARQGRAVVQHILGGPEDTLSIHLAGHSVIRADDIEVTPLKAREEIVNNLRSHPRFIWLVTAALVHARIVHIGPGIAWHQKMSGEPDAGFLHKLMRQLLRQHLYGCL